MGDASTTRPGLAGEWPPEIDGMITDYAALSASPKLADRQQAGHLFLLFDRTFGPYNPLALTPEVYDAAQQPAATAQGPARLQAYDRPRPRRRPR